MLANNSLSTHGYFTARQGENGFGEAESALTKRLVYFVVIGATTYQAFLCLIHTHLFQISGTIVGFAEFILYLACFSLLIRRVSLDFVATVTLLAAYMLLLALLRSYLDSKGVRDMAIPILFYWVGRSLGSVHRADNVLKIVIAVVLFFGCFEMFFLKAYSTVFNVFSYYTSQGGLAGVTNWATGSAMALNGVRPEGIGRTILPSLLGSNRVSSIFMEPVSLGNFAVIVSAWGLSKGRDQIKKILFYLICATVMIIMSDSRYGMFALLFLVILRLVLPARMGVLAIVMPLLAVMILMGTVWSGIANYGDNMSGRFLVSGKVLLDFTLADVIGLGRFTRSYGDMGYAVSLTRYGLILCSVLWIAFWLIKMYDERGLRFRTYIATYISLILMISEI
jgi:putative polymerase